MSEAATVQVNGVSVAFERRRYGRTCYTWALADFGGGELVTLGDPWPSVRVRRAELEQAVEYYRAKQGEGAQG